MSSFKIRKVVFPLAGLGTRFLPATKSIPKEMLPVVDKPLIQYAVTEAVEAGAETLIFVIGKGKNSIEDYFDRNLELEGRLQSAGKKELANLVRELIPQNVSYVYLRQFEPRGLGDAILCAEAVVGSDPFGVILADDLIHNNGSSPMEQLCGVYHERGCNVVAVEEVAASEVHKYGIIDIDSEALSETTWKLSGLVEKPDLGKAPSNLGIVGRYILVPDIMPALKKTACDSTGEIQLTDALNSCVSRSGVVACRFHGKRFDCGSKLGYMKANVEMGKMHDDIGEELKEYLKTN